MKLRTYVMIGTLAFNLLRRASRVQKSVRRNMKHQVRRAGKVL